MLPIRLVLDLVLGLASVPASAAEWVPYVNDRFGFSFRYPADLFAPERMSEAGDGEVFTGMRGKGRLLVGALENRDGHTLASYMNLIRKQSYARFSVDYSPRGGSWFVLSGKTIARSFTRR